jgi:trans-aconitate methyltransferase
MMRTATEAKEWDAQAYQRVSAPQFEWGQKVLRRLSLRGDEVALDAGCGTGRLTAELCERLPRGRVVGLDRSANMIGEARQRLAHLEERERVAFRCGDLLELEDEEAYDLVFSTATFHWVLDHPRLFTVLFRALRPGGSLVAQCGGAGNLDRVRAHAAALMAAPPYAPFFEGWSSPWEYAGAEVTRARLRDAGFTEIETGLELAPTRFASPGEFTEFVTSVIFRVHLDRLPDEAWRRSFVAAVTERAAGDDPPWVLDYIRLNLEARRPTTP